MYRFLVVDVVVLTSERCAAYDEVEPFCFLEVESNQGTFVFNLKEDVRSRERREEHSVKVTSYIIEMIPPEHLEPDDEELGRKSVLVIKAMLFKLNRQVLVDVLVDIYLTTRLEED